MDKNTTPRGPEVKGTKLVKALGLRLFRDWPITAVEVLAFLMSHGGDWHAASSTAWRDAALLPKPSYYRILGWLETEEVIEVCTDKLCPHRRFGPVGWRVTLRFREWMESLSAETKWSQHRDQRVSALRLPESSETRGTQGKPGLAGAREVREGKERTAYAARRSAPGRRNETVMTPKKRKGDEEWEGSSLGEDPDRPVVKPGSPVNRIRVAFREEARRLGYMGPITSIIARQNANIRWMLENGYSEETVLGSFRYLTNIIGRQAVGEENPLWEVYFRNRAELLQQAYHGGIGHREGEEPISTDEFAQQQMERQERRRGLH